MEKRCGCRRNIGRGAERAAQEERAAVRAAEDMPMCRHVGSMGTSTDNCCIERQLCLILQMLDQQSRMLAELLQEVRGQ